MKVLNNRFFGCLLVAALFLPILASAMVGKVIYAAGEVKAINAQGVERALRRGSKVFNGDQIQVAVKSRAQVRFTDGGFMSLRPATHFTVDEYKFKGKADGTEKGFFSLLKGGFRALTGAIGRKNRPAYQVRTAVATIGIRGTGYNAQLCQSDCVRPDGEQMPDGLYGKTNLGTIFMRNAGGVLDLAPGQMAYVHNANTAPVQTFQMPLMSLQTQEGGEDGQEGEGAGEGETEGTKVAAGDGEGGTISSADGYVAGDELTDAAVPELFGDDADSIAGGAGIGGAHSYHALAYAYSGDGEYWDSDGYSHSGDVNEWGWAQSYPMDGAVVTYDSNGVPQSFQYSEEWTDPYYGGTGSYLYEEGELARNSASLYEYGKAPNTNVQWGRWVGNWSARWAHADSSGYSWSQTADGTDSAMGLHWMWGTATPDHVVTAMTGTATYSDVGGTLPRDHFTGVAGVLNSAAVHVNFSNATINTVINLTHDGNVWNANLVGYLAGHNLWAWGDTYDGGSVSCSGSGCSGSGAWAYGDLGGVFVGSQAQGIASGVNIWGGDDYNYYDLSFVRYFER